MTRFAVHILAHQHPHLFGDLVASLNHPAVDVFAHIDRRTDHTPFAEAVTGFDRVHFVADRVAVRWGGLSVVRAALSGLEAAAAIDTYHRHSLLSGVDVGLQPLPEILATWSGDQQILRIDRRPGSVGDPHGYTVDRLHFPDHPPLQWLSGRLPRRPHRRFTLHQGSMWWSLTGPAVDYLRLMLAEHRGWLRHHRFALCPDEIVVHSILADSPFSADITQNYADDDPLAGLENPLHGQHYIDWSDIESAHPVPLTEADLPRAVASGALFARKVGPDWTWRLPA